jgi:peptidoglycan hydrolase-like protein with peptidoglycan-binding domain
MNTNSASRISVRFVAVITAVSLILSAFPASFFVANAQENTETAPVETSVVTDDQTQNGTDGSEEGAGDEEHGDEEGGESFFGAAVEPFVQMFSRQSQPDPKVTICHANGQSGNYTQNSVSENSVLSNGQNGHGNHNNDIIPPFGNFGGRNWDAYGQAIWNNQCNTFEAPAVTVNTVGKLQCGVQDITLTGTVTFSNPTSQDSFVIKLDGVVVVDDEDIDDAGPDGIPYNWSKTLTGVAVGAHTVEVIIFDNPTNNTGVKATASTEFTVAACPTILRVEKVVEGGKAVASDFSFSLDGGEAMPFSSEGVELKVTAGTHTVTEVAPANYTASYENCQGVNVVEGQVTTCVVTNTYVETPVCRNLLTNGSFESEVVTDGSLWQKFASVTGWTIAKVSDSLATTLELHRGWSGNDAAHGEQYAELDGDHSTKVTQSAATIPGAEYKLSWAFAPRHNIDAAQNKLSVKVNGSEVATNGPATDGAPLDVADWTKSNVNFVATGSSTLIEFADAGASDSYGTFLDDAQLCLVKEPEPIKTCTLTIKSDTTNTVLERENANAVETWMHGSWIKTLPLAKWIWADEFAQEPRAGEQYTFEKKFGWNPDATVTSATLKIAADNLYQTTLNASLVADEITPNNINQFAALDAYVLPTTSILDGNNLISSIVKNVPWNTDSAKSNPGGLYYELVITGEGAENCEVPYEEEPETYTIDGYKFNDVDGDGYWGKGEPTLSGWEINLMDGDMRLATTTTNGEGYYSFTVEAGDYQVTETQQSGWTQTATLGEADGPKCYFSFGEESWVKKVAEMVYDNPYEGQCVFGNHQDEDDDYTETISGFKWNDLDGDGTRDEDEPTLANWVIGLYDGETLVATTSTNGAGFYSFEVEEGEWTVAEMQQSGWTQTGTIRNNVALASTTKSCAFEVSDYEYSYDRSASRSESYNSCDFGNKQNQVIDEEPERNGSSGTRTKRPRGQVLGATTQCGLWLEDYMQKASQNDSYQVLKLQVFLNLQGFVTPLTGIFDTVTEANVKQFQSKYYDEVIKPWFDRGIVPHNRPTGFVYKTTRWKINDIMCPGIEPYPSFDGENLSTNVLLSR